MTAIVAMPSAMGQIPRSIERISSNTSTYIKPSFTYVRYDLKMNTQQTVLCSDAGQQVFCAKIF